MNGPLIGFSINGVRGVLKFAAQPDGKSFDLVGDNGEGKTSTIDALWWGLGGTLDGEIVRNGSEEASTEIRFADYLVTRKQARGKAARLDVRSADGKAKFTSPTALLAGFREALGRLTFSAMPSKARADVIRKLAPGLDVSDLVKRRAELFTTRTEIGRVGEQLAGQLAGVVLPEAPADLGEERPVVDAVDVVAIASKRGEVEKVRAENDRLRRAAATARDRYAASQEARTKADEAVEAARRALAEAERLAAEAEAREEEDHLTADQSSTYATQLVDPDTSAIDAEIAAARATNEQHRASIEAHNRSVRAAVQAASEVRRATEARDALAARVQAERERYKAHTAQIDAIDKEREARIAAAAKSLPVAGLGLADGIVTFDDGEHGPVEIDSLNTAARFALDVELAAAQNHRIVAVRDASLLGKRERAKVDALAKSRGVQLICEVVADGAVLSAEIVEATTNEGSDQ